MEFAERLPCWRTRRIGRVLLANAWRTDWVFGVECAKSASGQVRIGFAGFRLASGIFRVELAVWRLASRIRRVNCTYAFFALLIFRIKRTELTGLKGRILLARYGLAICILRMQNAISTGWSSWVGFALVGFTNRVFGVEVAIRLNHDTGRVSRMVLAIT